MSKLQPLKPTNDPLVAYVWSVVEARVERLHRTLLDEHFRVEGRRTWFETIEEMQKPLDEYLAVYNTKRPHQGRGMNGRTPLTAFIEGIPKSAPAKGGDRTPKTTDNKAA